MNVPRIAIIALLSLSAVVCIACGIGVMIMRGAYDKLHYLAPAGILGTAAVAAAIVVDRGFTSTAGIKSLVIAVVLIVSGPVITQAAAAAVRIRKTRKSNGKPEKV